MTIEAEQSRETCSLKLDGEWTIERAQELKQLLLDAIGRAQHLILDAGKLTAADLSCLQILCSAHRTSVRAGIRITIKSSPSEVLKRAANDAGFFRTVNCRNIELADCLWKGDWA